MYAIIQTAGKQFRAEPGRTLRLPSMKGEPGAKVVFDQVLLGSDGKTVKAGAPMVKGAKVTAEILGHVKGDKVYVFNRSPHPVMILDRSGNFQGSWGEGGDNRVWADPRIHWMWDIEYRCETMFGKATFQLPWRTDAKIEDLLQKAGLLEGLTICA